MTNAGPTRTYQLFKGNKYIGTFSYNGGYFEDSLRSYVASYPKPNDPDGKYYTMVEMTKGMWTPVPSIEYGKVSRHHIKCQKLHKLLDKINKL